MTPNLIQSLRAFLSQAAVSGPLLYVIHDTTISASRVEGESMQPTLNPGGSKCDFVLLNKVRGWSGRDSYRRGDVVVFRSPGDPTVLMIKRVIGTEGDSVRTLPRCSDQYVQVPKGHVWVEGDSSHSFDSSHFGPIPMALIQAQASHVIWPPTRWSRIESTYPRKRVVKARTKTKRAV